MDGGLVVTLFEAQGEGDVRCRSPARATVRLQKAQKKVRRILGMFLKARLPK